MAKDGPVALPRMSLEGKVAIVTGGSRGIGRAIALGYLRAGAKGVAVTASESENELREVERTAQGITGDDRCLALLTDVTDPKGCERVISQTIAHFGAVHVLVNNAAKGTRHVADDFGPFWEADPAGWKRVMDTNVNGPFYMARAAVPHMLRKGWGRIVNLTKTTESMYQLFGSPEGPSKAALETATMIWAQDLLDTGISVNSISPGSAVDTDFEPEKHARVARAAGRLMHPNVVVPIATWLASDNSNGVTGSRFTAKLWDPSLPPNRAAERCRETPIYKKPAGRPSPIIHAWQETPLGDDVHNRRIGDGLPAFPKT